jgi:hypothetical protein
MLTVCKKDLGHDELLGHTLWGDSHRAGTDKITRVTFAAEIVRREAARERSLRAVENGNDDGASGDTPENLLGVNASDETPEGEPGPGF